MSRDVPSGDAPVPHRVAIRRLMRGSAKASLATCLDGAQGWPYASLVTVATAQDGSPILLLSGLSDHTRNLEADPRLSLLFDGTDGFANPQQGPRVTLLGRARRCADPACRARFLARHPAAATYAGFGDFAFWQVEMERAHYVGGFARAVWIEDRLGADAAAARQLAEAEAGILEHMNRDHPGTVQLFARELLGRTETEWRLAGVDVDGCDLVSGERLARLHFDTPLAGAAAVRPTLMDMAERARRRAADGDRG